MPFALSRFRLYCGIALFGAAHRALQFVLVRPQLDPLLDATAGSTTMQLLPREIWREHFGAALWYLQQTPPLPNLVWGTLWKLGLDWHGVSYALFALQALTSIATALLLTRTLLVTGVAVWFAAGVSTVFLLSGDLLLMEYQFYGQVFYENLAMFWMLLALVCYGDWRAHRGVGSLVAAGLAVAMLALTRASFSWFFLLPLWLLLVERPRVGGRALAAFCLPVALLHGGWALKNAVVFGYFSMETSTWSGLNLCLGDFKRGQLPGVAAYVAEHPGRFPDWWRSRLEGAQAGYQRLIAPPPPESLPDRVREVDGVAARALGTELPMNSLALRSTSALARRTYAGYWWSNPANALSGWWASYQLFWLPIRSYAGLIPTVFTIDLDMRPARAGWRRIAAAPAGLERYRIARGSRFAQAREAFGPVRILALPVLPLLVHGLNVLLLHAAPLLFVAAALKRRGWPSLPLPAGFALWMLSVAYLALLANLAEYGENARFRLAVEPVIWLISIALLRASSGARGPPGAPS